LTDEELAKYLVCTPEQVLKLTPQKRAAYEALVEKGMEIDLWESGVGPRPADAILCGPKQVRALRK
jgi:hypothetical protein